MRNLATIVLENAIKICTFFNVPLEYLILGDKANAKYNDFELFKLFTEADNLVTLNDLQDALYYYREENNDKFLRYYIQPIEKAVKHLSKCWIQLVYLYHYIFSILVCVYS